MFSDAVNNYMCNKCSSVSCAVLRETHIVFVVSVGECGASILLEQPAIVMGCPRGLFAVMGARLYLFFL